jgi:hypothetical protein
MLGLLPDYFYHLFACLELINPIFPHPLYLSTEFILFEPKDQFSYFPTINFFYQVGEDDLDDSALVFDGFEHSIEVLGESLEDGGLFGESVLVFLSEVGHFGDI